ncbi:MAG: hypothetical protein E7473_04995 [Ruminococcaceae bacterium]|nr:hypothetical protein [Oscillospiraceae bacterium]
MAKEKNTIKREMAKIVRKKLPSSYAEGFDFGEDGKGSVTVLRAIALAQVKKSLEGDLRATEFIEKLLCSGEESVENENFDVVVKVVGEENGA